MANSYIPKWQNISVSFNDANSMMDTAMSGISKAGTVFSKLRDDIAAEEQRAAEAAYKQQIFDENVRQFDLEQAWNRENAEADRRFQMEQAEKADKRARELVQLRYNLDNQAKNKNIAAYNALNTFFMDAYKKTGDLAKAADETRAYHNANYGNVLFDAGKIFGNLADAVTQSYSPENRLLQGWTTVQEGATAEANLPGIDKTLKDSYNGFFTKDGIVAQVGADGNILFVPDSPERKQFLDLNSDKARYTQMGQGARDFLKSAGFGPLELNRILSGTASKSVEDQEAAALAIASKLGVTQPDKIPVINAIMKGADASRATKDAAAKSEIERKKTFTPEAYNKAYMEVHDDAGKNEDTKDIFNVGKNPALNASIELLSEAMRKQEAPASEFKKILKKLKTQGSGGWFSNNDITSKNLNNPVLIEARNKFLPNLVESTVKKPEINKTDNSGVGNVNKGSASTSSTAGTNTNNVVTPPPTATTSTTNTSEDLKSTDIKLTPRIVKQLKTQRNILQQALKAQDTKDTQQITKRIAYLDSAIANLQNKKAITVADADAYTYIKELLDRTGIREIKANDAGDPIFTGNINLASRLLRLLETPSK